MNISRNRTRSKINRMTGIAILSAIIVVVQVICTFVKFGPFSITLALAPIIIGGAIYGAGAGAFLGAVMGGVVLITGLFGWDGGVVMYLMGQNPFATILLCIVKSAAAGCLSAVICRLISKKNELAGVITASVICPIVNTGLFVLGMAIFFMPTLTQWAAGEKMLYYVLFGLAGWNFIVELGSNLILAGAVNRIIHAVKNSPIAND